MKRLLPGIAASTLLALAGAAAAGLVVSGKQTSTFAATLSPRASVPAVKAPAGAAGTFTATVTADGASRSIAWKLTFKGLSGRAVAAHLHRGRPGTAGAVLLALCGPCRSGQTGRAEISKGAADALAAGRVYANVHTARNAAGEIRGQVRLTGRSTTPAGTGSTGTSTTVPTDTGPIPGY